ncbi:MAG TPA: hypothetical protein VLB29_03560 [Nocardioidaceae bacterium]|nr:hypothetical protein [Nocardioidaceae bacterium]
MQLFKRMAVAAVVLLTALGTTAFAAEPQAEGAQPQDCFWTSVFDEENGNLFYPDTGVNYYLGRVNLPPGGELVIRGRYPHARYTSFNAYDELFRPKDALADTRIRPDRGSTNPFVAGHRRDLPLRDFTVRVVSDPPPGKRARNTVYLGYDRRPSFVGNLVYRVYLPDRGRDQFGGVGLPEVALRLPDGTEVDQPAACTLPTDQPSTGLTRTDQRSSSPATFNHTTAKPRPDWERFFNVTRTMARQFSQDAAEAAGDEQRGGFFSDRKNAYVYAFVSREYGEALVLRGRLPDIPETYAGQRRFERAPLRYWSLCNGSVQPYGATDTIGCVHDEQVRTDRRGRFTIVLSTPELRPANARRACGVTWMPWGARPNAALIMRNQLPSPWFKRAIQRVTKPGTEREVMGAYLPRGRYTSTAAFERRGC